MPVILLNISLFFSLLYPQLENKYELKILAEHKKLYKPSKKCLKSLEKHGLDYYEVLRFGESVNFYDGTKSRIIIKFAGIIPFSNRTEPLNDYIQKSTPQACLVAAIDKNIVWVFDAKCLKAKNLLHEYLHLKLNVDDRDLPKLKGCI